MDYFEYKVSVIVPVYNVEAYLRACLDSLLAQTIDHELMEVLLINDGSTDSSLEICKEYAELFSMFKLFSQENAGVSAARNLGIKNASGKYIMYLDSDDMLTPETVREVSNFFDQIYNDVDLVTYKIMRFQNGKQTPLHFRYRYLNKNGIYDLNDFPYVSQTSMNIVVKNLLEKNVFFKLDLRQGEDQNYILQYLSSKNKIGYVDKGTYMYYVRADGAVQIGKNPIELFEQRTSMWESIFADYFGRVPKYIQALVLANYIWELTSNCLFPYHYDKKAFDKAVSRIQALLTRIDAETIMEHPTMDTFHKHFWLSLKKNINPVVVFDKNEAFVYCGGLKLYSRKNFEIVLNKIDVENGEASIQGFIKSPIFNYIDDEPVLIAVLNGEEHRVSLFDSINSHYKTKTRTNHFFGFRFKFKVSESDKVFFNVNVDNIVYSTQLYCLPSSGFNINLGVDYAIRENIKIFRNNNTIQFRKVKDIEKRELLLEQKFKIAPSNAVSNLRKHVINNNKKQRVWLYCDRYTIGIDNGFLQFQHDFDKDDGVLRYYVCDNNKDSIESSFTERQRKFLIESGSNIHKILFLQAEYVLCSFSDLKPRIPFENEDEYSFYRDLPQPKVIYLQHGVLHADLTWTQSVERCKFDKVIVSAVFERNNYINKYNFESKDVIATGMPRFDHINKDSTPKNRILFAPSWRSYLVDSAVETNGKSDHKKLMCSNYFKLFSEFLKSESLIKLLDENDLYLDAKLHQNMKDIFECFDILSERISFISDTVNVEDYKIFITDISSFVFDYAYLNRPVIYFMPDMEEFKAGMNHYRELDLPWEQAFGNLVTDPEEAVNEIIRIVENDFVPDPIFKERMDNFYLPLENCAERLYEWLMSNS